MKQEVILILAMCAFTAAMVPRDKLLATESSTSTPTPTKEICASNTPCAWTMYKPNFKILEHQIQNNYCNCGPGTVCVINEDDLSVNAYVHRCRPPSEPSLFDS